MSKNIVICSDGTGNTTIKGRGTNVFKLYEAVDLQGHQRDPRLTRQIAFYDDGVGTERLKPIMLLGGAFGVGLSRNIKQMYAELARVYEPGDRIFLFGFSRGAFTVRTLAGIIVELGVLDRNKYRSDTDLWKGVDAAYREHRRRYRTYWGRRFRKPYDENRLYEFRKHNAVSHPEHAPDGKVQIEFMGVWDTVDAYGFPSDHISDFWNEIIYAFKFPDTRLSKQVKRACHAVAIDDERHTFEPVMWDEENETSGRIEQVWFAGVHSNVGGGYPKQGMSLVALAWMMERAQEQELRFIPEVRDLFIKLQNANDKLYDSRAGFAIYYRYKPRDIGKLCNKFHTSPKIHISAIDRIAQGTEGYAPGNLPRNLEIVDYANRRLDDRRVPQMFQQALDGINSLLDRTKSLITVRKYLHYALVILSVVAVWLTLSEPEVRAQNLVSANGLGQVQWVLFKTITASIWLPALLIGVYVAGWWCTERMNVVYSEFWYQLRPKMQPEREPQIAKAKEAGRS